jgi:mRNA interferase MazF
VIEQGDVFWCDFPMPIGSGPGFRRPVVVLQNDAVNRSGIRSVIVCPLSTNLRLGTIRGNVLFDDGEAGLQEASVVNVFLVSAVDQTLLEARIGNLSRARVQQIVDGLVARLRPEL